MIFAAPNFDLNFYPHRNYVCLKLAEILASDPTFGL